MKRTDALASKPRQVLAALAAASLLAACGGGGSAPEPEVPAAERRVTLQEYLGSRVAPAPAVAASGASLLDAGLAYAVPALTARLGHGNDVVVLPPLEAAFDNLVRSAARGSTLAELDSRRPAAGSAAVQAAQLAGIERRLWVAEGAPLRSAYLTAVDVPGLSWQATAVGDWGAATQRDIAGVMELQELELKQQTRLVVRDSWVRSFAWPQVQTFAARVADNRMLAMLRLRGPMHYVRGVGYESWTMALGEGRRLVGLVPDGIDLAAFASDRLTLARALAAAAAAELSTEGDWELPLLALSSPAPDPGLSLAYDRVQANLGGLDGGGSYLRSSRSVQTFGLTDYGLYFQGWQSLAFHFDSSNVGAQGDDSGGSGTTWVRTPGCPEAVVAPRPMLLALLDDSQRLLVLVAVEQPMRQMHSCDPGQSSSPGGD